MYPIYLASTSKYRLKLLQDIGINAIPIAPKADENSITLKNNTVKELAEKRALLKAKSITLTDLNLIENSAQSTDGAPIIIAGDQIAQFAGEVLGKPGSTENAIEQLGLMNGKSHELITAMVLCRGDKVFSHTDITTLTMHELSDQQISDYVLADQPLDCAGSYKIESRGLWLFKDINSEDFTAIQGLPMLALTNQLTKWSVGPLLANHR